jgi:hypothetical protein
VAKEIAWTAFLRVNTASAADKLVRRLREALGEELRVSEVGQYWKDDALYRCAFSTPLVAETSGDALAEGLRLAGSLAPSWEVGNLSEPDRLWSWARKGVVIAGIDHLNSSSSEATKRRSRLVERALARRPPGKVGPRRDAAAPSTSRPSIRSE